MTPRHANIAGIADAFVMAIALRSRSGWGRYICLRIKAEMDAMRRMFPTGMPYARLARLPACAPSL